MNIREEFAFDSVENSLKELITTVIVGPLSQEERCRKIRDAFGGTKAKIISIDYNHDTFSFRISNLNEKVKESYNSPKDKFPDFLSRSIAGYDKNILIDLTSLQHSVIMVLMGVLCNNIRPAHLFASYVKPKRYITRDELGKYNLSTEVSEPEGIPGLIRQRKENEVVIPFLGFEGDRLHNIIETMTYDTIVPVIGFPSEDPAWQFDSLRNCMAVLNSACPDAEIYKCKSNSIYDAINVIRAISDLYPDKFFVLLPLGIRTHTAACGLWAAKHKNTRIMYDYAIETEIRSEGIGDAIIYHLSRFI